jgi:hypothetical protein
MAINETETAAAIGPRGGPDDAAGGADFVLRSDDGTARRTPAPSMEGASVRPNAGNAAKVVRAILTSSVREREPVDTLAPGERVSSSQGLYLFTELRDLAGRSVEHRWMYGDRVISSARYGVGSDRWRLYSKKPAAPTLKGPWQAVVVDSQGDVLAAASFIVE